MGTCDSQTGNLQTGNSQTGELQGFDPLTFDAVAYINTPRWQDSRYGLDRIIELANRLGRPQDKLKFVHVAGTNGKGSTCAYIANVLQAAGYKVGLFTSPYIKRFEERIQINGQIIPEGRLREVTLKVWQHAEAMAAENTEDHPTEFELMAAVAYLYFAEEHCDIVVAEVGLGGRYDATNIIDAPEVSVIVRLGLDHTALLGDTLAQIAGEKAGIIKQGCAVVSYPQEPEAAAVVEAEAEAHGVTVCYPDFSALDIGSATINEEAGSAVREFSYKGMAHHTQLLGSYQPNNATVALEAIEVLRKRGWHISDQAVQTGIANTAWPGRFEIIDTHPLTIVDGGHNPQCATAMAQTLEELFPGRKVTFVIGILADKDFKDMLRIVVPFGKRFITVTPNSPRALPAADLATALQEVFGEVALDPENQAVSEGQANEANHNGQTSQAEVLISESFNSAAAIALNVCAPTEVIVAFGSLYSVGAVCEAFENVRKSCAIKHVVRQNRPAEN